jgi:hypothetical protein
LHSNNKGCTKTCSEIRLTTEELYEAVFLGISIIIQGRQLRTISQSDTACRHLRVVPNPSTDVSVVPFWVSTYLMYVNMVSPLAPLFQLSGTWGGGGKDRQQGDIKTLLSFFQTKESRLIKTHIAIR